MKTLMGAVVVVLLFALSLAADESERTVSVGLRKQLFVDDYIVANRRNVVRELGVVTKANRGMPVLVADRPWESDSFLIGSVFREGDKFKMFYKVGYADPEPNDPPGITQLRVAYAESSDGLHWSKPDLGIRTFQGSKKNNLINPMGMTCLPDPHETDPRHRYKAAYTHWQKMMAAIAHSPDGLHWKPYNDGQPVTYRAADTISQLLWDPTIHSYRLYTRTDYQSKLKAKIEVRGTRDMTNPNIKADPTAWKTVREWSFDRPDRAQYHRRQIYSLNGWIYEGVHFGLLWCYEWPGDLSDGPHDLHVRHERDIMNFYLLTTRRELPWNLEWVDAHKPLIPRGPPGSFDKDWVQPAINIVTWNDKHWIYYAGGKERHNVKGSRPISIGLATLRLDGFTYFKAKHDSGFVETKPFQLSGRSLQVNADAENGKLLVEVLDRLGNPINGLTAAECQSITTDGLRQTVLWSSENNLESLKGKIVRLRFHLSGATKLFAFQLSR
jgi:hypothetical protein